MDELLSQFAQREPRTRRIALQVTDYILPAAGTVENPQNARVLGVDTKTGQMIEVALRPFDGERPTIGQFHDDSASATPVTTAPGGSIVVEGALETTKLKPLSGQAYPVYSARWLVRAGKDQDHGRASILTARVNDPRVNASNPAKGSYQTITLLKDENPGQIRSIAELDRAVLDAMDPSLHPMGIQSTHPGALGAVVRLEAPDKSASEMIELHGGFHLPQGAQHRVPKTRPMVADDLKRFSVWQKKRALTEKALQAGYNVSVIESRTMMVGPKAMKGNNVMPVKNDAGTNLFTNYAVAMRFREDGSAFAISAGPEGFERVPSRTGLPNAEERAQSQIRESVQAAAPANAPAQPSQVTNQSAPAPAQPAPQQTAKPEPLLIRRTSAGPLQVSAASPQQAAALQKLAGEVEGQFDQSQNAMSLDERHLPALIQKFKNAQLDYRVDLSRAEQAPAQTNAQAPSEPPTRSTDAPAQESAQAAPQEDVDLSMLDLSNIDIDGALAQAYGSQQPPKGQTR